jgi:aldose 1-epimerase
MESADQSYTKVAAQAGSVKSILKEKWGAVDGQEVFLYHLTGPSGMKLSVSNYGGIIQSLFTAGKTGKYEDIVLGYDTLEEYISDPFYIGSIAGRYANRIDEGKITIDEIDYQLSILPEGYHLHGGNKGFNKVVWKAEEFEEKNSRGIKLSYLSKHLEEGFPGNLSVTVTYSMDDTDRLTIEYAAETDQTTCLNLTQHSYFNLSGKAGSSVENHLVKINADHFLPVNDKIIPTGKFSSVKNTPFDFTSFHTIGERINKTGTQLAYGNGYDHSFVLEKTHTPLLKEAAAVTEPESGRCLRVQTTEPGIHFYSGNYLKNKYAGKQNIPFQKRSAFCLETQHFGDSPNKPQFPATWLRPGEKFYSKTIYEFTVMQ